MGNKVEISVVSPVYKAENIIATLVAQIDNEVKKITPDYEIILVEDCSLDKSWLQIEKLAKQNNKIKGYKLSRNFGQHAAIKAGIEQANGNCCIVIDCDLQDDPKYIHPIYTKYKEGFDIIYTYKKKRKHSFFKNLTARVFNVFFNFLLDNKSLESDKNIGAYSLISKKVMTAFLSHNDYQFHYLLVLRWLGFKSSYIEISHNKRFSGKSSYTLKKLFSHALIAITYHSDKLLKFNIYIGVVIAFFAFIFSVFIVGKSLIHGFQVGWASIFVLILFSFGFTLASLGIIGLYLGKLFDQTKRRPQYIIDKITE